MQNKSIQSESYIPDINELDGNWNPIDYKKERLPPVGSIEYKKYMYDSISDLLQDYLRNKETLLPGADVAVKNILENWHKFTIYPTDISKDTWGNNFDYYDEIHEVSSDGFTSVGLRFDEELEEAKFRRIYSESDTKLSYEEWICRNSTSFDDIEEEDEPYKGAELFERNMWC